MAVTATRKNDARVSLTDQAYEVIKRHIVTTAFAPGSYINEVQLSEDLGIGRTPVHQALHRLAQEALVDILPRKGVIVRPISLDEVAQIIEVRLVAEPYCTSQAASRITQSALEEPKRYLALTADELNGDANVERLMELDCQFHAWISRIAGNQVMADILKQLQDRSSRFWFLSLSDSDHSHRVYEEHSDILKAIAARDPNTAADAARRHIESFRNTLLRVI
jgi:DNA-binding GntR family transcriptional regulator